MFSAPSGLITPLRNAYPTAKATDYAVWRLVDAEIDFYVRRNLLDRCNGELTKLALEHVELYDERVQLPNGYDSGGIVKEQNAMEKHLESEALVSAYLDGYYIVTERLCTATSQLNQDSGNVLWSNIRGVRPHLKKVRGKPVLLNLLEDFANSSAEAAGHRDKILRALEIRGSRTHRRHFQVFIEHQEGEERPVTVYANANPFQSTSPIMRFDDRERGELSKALLLFLDWWCAQIRTSLGVP